MSVVSSVLSRVSTRSRPSAGWNVNVSSASLMDSLFSIAFGLGLRFVVDTVSHQDFKLTGTLVGLWEGVILLHFTKKMPKSSDPYIAFAVRLCVDFFLTESVARLVLVLIWTGLGMILADITPAIWSDVGLNRVWRRLRRDLYTIAEMVPTVAFFPPQRTVRFSPSHAPSAIGDDDDAASDITATAQTPSAPVPPPNPILPPSRDARKRRVPGHYGFEYSDTETERSFAPRTGHTSTGRTSRRLSVYPGQAAYGDSASDSISSITPIEDVDAGNLSDGASSSAGTERAGPSSTSLIHLSEVQGTEQDADATASASAAAVLAPTIDTAVAAKQDDEAGNRTPTQQPLWIPPTPSDSAAAWRLSRAREAASFDDASSIKPIRPLGEPLAQIPDFLDEPLTEDWTDLGKSITAAAGAADPFTTTVTTTTTTAPAPAPTTTEAPTTTAAAGERNSLLDPPAYEAWPSSGPAEREYKTAADFDDIYSEEVPPTAALAAAAAAVHGEASAFAGQTGDLLGGEGEGEGEGKGEDAGAGAGAGAGAAPAASATGPWPNVWGDQASHAHLAEQTDAAADAAMEKEAKKLVGEITKLEQEKKDLEEKEAEVKRIAEAAEAERLAAEEKEAEAEAKRIADEAAAEAEAAAAAEAEAEAKRVAEEAEAKRVADEAVAAAKKEKKERKKKEADDRKAKEDADKLAREQKRAEEEAKEAEQKRKDAEAAEGRRALKQKDKADAARKAKEELERKAKEEWEAAERKAVAEREEAAERKAKEEREEAEHKAKEAEQEEAARKAEEEQVERDRQEKEEGERKEKEEAERQAREEEEKQAEWDAIERTLALADAAIAAAALDSARAQESEDAEAKATEQEQAENATSPGQEAAAGDLAVSTGFSSEALVDLHEPLEHEAPTTAPDAYEESVVSDATAGMPPPDPTERLERSMILRAQMVEIQKQIDDLKADGAGDDSAEVKQMDKIMRKMVRQATRRYEAGIACAQYLNGFDDTSNVVSLENMHPVAVMKKIAEQMENLLSPSARSLHFSIQVAKKAGDAKKQKPKVLDFIDEFNLINYASENARNQKISEIDIPEEAFGTWLTEYRNLIAKRAQQQEEPHYDHWGNN